LRNCLVAVDATFRGKRTELRECLGVRRGVRTGIEIEGLGCGYKCLSEKP
jgi:hypothetical protein